MGGIGTGPSSQQTTQYPPWLQRAEPGLINAELGLAGLEGQPMPNLTPYPGVEQQIAPFSGLQNQAFNTYGNIANAFGNYNQQFKSLLAPAEAQQEATAKGAYLGPNPYLKDYYNQAAQGLTSEFQNVTSPSVLYGGIKTGTLGSSGQREAADMAGTELAQGLGTLGAQIYEPAYQFERGLQQQAAQNLPGMAASTYLPEQMMSQFAGQELGAGGLQQQNQQQQLNALYQFLQSKGQWPYQLLGQTASNFSGMPLPQLGSGTQTGPGLWGILSGAGK